MTKSLTTLPSAQQSFDRQVQIALEGDLQADHRTTLETILATEANTPEDLLHASMIAGKPMETMLGL